MRTGAPRLISFIVTAAVAFPFLGEVTEDSIHIRQDSTVSSEIVCSVNKGDYLVVVSEFFEWYKIRLPSRAPAFIHASLVLPLDDEKGRVLKDKVNIRLRPDERAPIVGQAKKDESVQIVRRKAGYCQIRPTAHTFGWIHKQFIKQVETKPKP